MRTKEHVSNWIAASASVLLFGSAVLVCGFQSQGTPPEITFDIDFPQKILADSEKNQSFVFFKDPDKDIVQIRFKLTESHSVEPLNFDPQTKRKLSGVIPFSIAVTSPRLELEICVGEEEQCQKIQVADSAPEEVSLSVTLTDKAGNSSEPKELSFNAEPVEEPNQPPAALFSYHPADPETSEEVTFDASASSDPDGEIVSYAWNFGDGTTDSGKNITHSYSSEGSYSVRLIVIDDDSNTDSITKSEIPIVTPKVEEPRVSLRAGELLYQDDFSDPSSGWLVTSDENCERQYVHGEYQILAKKQPVWCHISGIPDVGTFTDLVLEVDVRVGPGNGTVAILFRQANGWDQFYAVWIDGKCNFHVTKKKVGAGINDIWLQEDKKSSVLRRTPAWNHVKIAVKGPIILLYFNDQFAARFDDSTISKGGIALVTCNAEDITDGRFDNLRIYDGWKPVIHPLP